MFIDEADALRLAQAFVALTISREAGARYVLDRPADPTLQSLLNADRLALELLEGVLRSAVKPDDTAMPDTACVEMVM